MSYPDCFYYEDKQIQPQYSHTPKGSLDVDRLVHNLAPWKHPGLSPCRKPKALVFSSWAASELSVFELYQLKERFLKLMEEGFPLYLWQDGQVEPLTPETIYSLGNEAVLSRIKPEVAETIRKKAVSQQGLIWDQVFILDDYWTDVLLTQQNPLPPRELGWIRIENNTSLLSDLENSLKQAYPPLTHIVVDQPLIYADRLVNFFKQRDLKYFSNCPIIVRYSKLIINENFSSSQTDLADLTDIRWLEFNIEITDEVKRDIVLKLIPNLTTITIYENGNIQLLDNASEINLDNLEILDVFQSPMDSQNLQLLMKRARNLGQLKIDEYSGFEKLNFDDVNFSHLNILTLGNCVASPEQILSLLGKAPRLKYIEIDSCSKKVLEAISQSPHIEQLETLIFNNSVVDTSFLQKVLSRANNLEKLNLNISSRQKNKMSLYDGLDGEINIKKLKELNISGRNFSARFLESFIAIDNRLRVLVLENCNKKFRVENDRFTRPLNLEFLEELTLNRSHIDCENLHAILRQALKLKSLNLKNIDSPDWIKALLADDVHFTCLKKLKLPNEGYLTEDLQNLLLKTPALKELEVNFSNDQQRQNIAQEINLSNLEKFTAKNLPVTAASIFLLLKDATQLQEINLSPWNSPLKNQKINVGLNLPNLKRFNASDSSISLHILGCFLEKSRSLRELNLSNCTKLHRGVLDRDLNLEQLELLDLKGSQISLETVKAFLKAAPNLKNLSLPELEMDDECKKLISRIKIVTQEQNGDERRIQKEELFASHSKPISKVSNHESGTVDADTSLDLNTTFHIKRHFYPVSPELSNIPEIELYRQLVFTEISINEQPCDMNQAFILKKNNDAILHPQTIPESHHIWAEGKKMAAAAFNEQDYYMCRQDFILDDEWQAIASISPMEVMNAFQIVDKERGKKVKVELAYSEHDNLYYIRSASKDRQYVSMDFLISVKKTAEQKAVLPKEIQDLVDFFTNFDSTEPKPLDLSQYPNPSGSDYLACILTQRSGACRHRAVAFKAMMAQEHPHIPVRIIANDCHAFVEIYYQGEWITADLGGYPAELEIDQSNNPELMETDTDYFFEASAEEASYQRALKTWKKTKKTYDSVLTYCQHLCQDSPKKKRLITCCSDEDIKAMYLSVQDYCQRTSRPVFYVHSPEDLTCSAPYIKRQSDSDIGILTPGPGGALYDFLYNHKDSQPPPVLVVNYANFSADDIVRFNSMLNKQREIEGIALPEDLLLIGLINTQKPDCYQGEDFYGRLDEVDIEPLSPQQLRAHELQIASLPIREAGTETIPINLYHSTNWVDKLLGQWVIEEDRFRFKPGELWAALALANETGRVLEIQNGPWNDERFQLFWQKAKLQGVIRHAGLSIPVPNDFSIAKSEGYDWVSLNQSLIWEQQAYAQAKALNSGILSDYLARYEFNPDNHTLNTIPGWLELYSGSELPVCLTSPLSEDEWALLLAKCQHYGVMLKVYSPPDLTLPEMLERPIVQSEKPAWTNTSNTAVLVSNDLDVILHYLKKEQEKETGSWQIIDISESEAQNLLIHTEAQLNKVSGELVFSQSERALLDALAERKTVILKGRFSQSLLDDLSPFLLKRLQDETSSTGRLILLTENSENFPFMLRTQIEVNARLKQNCLLEGYDEKEVESLKPEQLETECLSQLKARLNYQRRHVTLVDTDEAWAGLRYLPGKTTINSFDLKRSQHIVQTINEKRLHAVNAVLAQSPYVFLAGLTGVGKSTFVEKVFGASEDLSLYRGESQIKDWASDQSGKRKVLFIDEANLSASQWSEFEGLFNDPPGILIDGVYHRLSPNHQVIFAGNPLHYGDERQLAPLFIRHGNTVVFEPLPIEYIYESLLKPVFEESGLDEERVAELCTPMLRMYAFLCNCSKEEILITPRELQMMALLTLAIYQKQEQPSEQAAVFAAEHYAYQLGQTLTPLEYRKAFDEQFKPPTPWQRDSLKDLSQDFLLTSSREKVAWQLVDLLLLRQHRCEQAVNDTQKYGGLGGIVIEGSPGIGKSDLTIEILKACGIKERSFYPPHEKDAPDPGPGFYRMPVAMEADEKRKLLLKAFDEGSVVIIDEINSSPMMERLLNDLLMGKTPEGKKPNNPGFMVIGTQNPVTLAGRRATSVALKRRLITTILPDYPEEELIEVLVHKGLSPGQARVMTDAFLSNRNKALREHKTPAPSFRDLLKLAEQVLKGKELAHQKESAFESLKNALLEALAQYHGRGVNQYRFYRAFPEEWCKDEVEHFRESLIEAADENALIESVINYFSGLGSDTLDLLLLQKIIESGHADLFHIQDIGVAQLNSTDGRIAFISRILESGSPDSPRLL